MCRLLRLPLKVLEAVCYKNVCDFGGGGGGLVGAQALYNMHRGEPPTQDNDDVPVPRLCVHAAHPRSPSDSHSSSFNGPQCGLL